MRFRECMSKNAGVAGYVKAFWHVLSESQTGQYINYLLFAVLGSFAMRSHESTRRHSTPRPGTYAPYVVVKLSRVCTGLRPFYHGMIFMLQNPGILENHICLFYVENAIGNEKGEKWR